MKCKVRVRTWWCIEATVEVEGASIRDVREKALVVGHAAHSKAMGHITKNQTTILETDGKV